MTWKERRNVTILLCIAGGLFLALLIVFGIIYRQDREEALAGKDGAPATLTDTGVPGDPGAYRTLRCYNGAATLSFTLDEKGVGHFYGHPAVSRELADRMLRRLKCAADFRETVVRLVEWHDRDIPRTDKSIRRALRILGWALRCSTVLPARH